MFNDSRDEELIDENLKNIYEKISYAIQSKNEIECSTAANAEKLIENENKLEEMEQILYKFRSQLTSNPILHEINKICQEDEALHRKSAEDIYEELKNISRIIDFFEMKNKNLHEKYSEGEQLSSLVTCKLDDQIECKKLIIKGLHSEALEVTNELKEEFEERKNNMKSDIEQLTKSIYDEEKDLAILLNDLEEGNILVQKSTEKGLKYKQDLSEMITLKQEITSSIEEDEIQFRKHESVLKHEIEEEVMKADDYKVKIGALKNKLNLQIEMNRIENEKLKSLKEIISKKVLHDLDKILKDNIAKGSNELCSIEEIIIVQEKIISDNKLVMKQFEDENIQLQMELDEQEKFKQKLNQEKIVRTEKKLIIQENIRKLTAELVDVCETNKNIEEELKNCSETENSLLIEKKNLEDNLTKILGVNQELYEKTNKLQDEIAEAESKSKNSETDALTEENKDLDRKIQACVRTIALLQKRRATIKHKYSPKRLKSDAENSDTSQDSMLISRNH